MQKRTPRKQFARRPLPVSDKIFYTLFKFLSAAIFLRVSRSEKKRAGGSFFGVRTTRAFDHAAAQAPFPRIKYGVLPGRYRTLRLLKYDCCAVLSAAAYAHGLFALPISKFGRAGKFFLLRTTRYPVDARHAA